MSDSRNGHDGNNRPITRPRLVVPRELLDRMEEVKAAREPSPTDQARREPSGLTFPEPRKSSPHGLVRRRELDAGASTGSSSSGLHRLDAATSSPPLGFDALANLEPVERNADDAAMLDALLRDVDFFAQEGREAPRPSGVSPHQGPPLQALLEDPDFWAVARANRAGTVLEKVGEMDADTVCAIASMAHQHFAAAAEMIGIGELNGWCIAEQDKTWYAHCLQDNFLVAVGGRKRNPVAGLVHLGEVCGGKKP